MPNQPTLFATQTIHHPYNEESETWWFSVVKIVQVLTQQSDYQTARKNWNKLKELLSKKGGQPMPSPKAEPVKLWLAKVGYERVREMTASALTLIRAREKWNQQRMTGQETRNKPILSLDRRADRVRGQSRHQTGRGIRHFDQPDSLGMDKCERRVAPHSYATATAPNHV